MPKPKVFGAPVPAAAEDLEWQSKGTCSYHPNPDLWFAEAAAERAKARAVCREYCPVRERCESYARVNAETFGVWGGYTFKSGRPIRDRPLIPSPRKPPRHAA